MSIVTVLFSGGIDSSACMAFYLEHGWQIQPLWVDYGQPAAREESMAVERLCRYYHLNARITRLEGIQWTTIRSDPVEYLGRNLTLLSLAVNQASPSPSLIAMGVHAGTNFPDCSREFVSLANKLVQLVSHHNTYFECPFLNWTKAELVGYAKSRRLPVHLTYSCFEGTAGHCGVCAKCQERFHILSNHW